MLRLSVIIPFYNVEQYIAQCLDSVYNQDIPEEEYEVICVNDASPDHSRDIVLEYQKKHSNLVLVEHEVNKKLGAARNTGRKVARGKYIWNVDSDDMIVSNCLKEILERCESNDLDVLLFCYDIYTDGLRIERDRPWEESPKPCSGIEFWKKQVISHQGEISQVWTQMYRREFLDEKHIFSPEINMAEDESYTYSSFLQAQRLMVTNQAYYVFRQNPTSLTSSLKNAPTPMLLYEESYKATKLLYGLMQYIPLDEKDVRQSVKNVIIYKIDNAWKYFSKMSAENRTSFRTLCLRNFFSNAYVFRVLNFKHIFQYLRFLFLGIAKNK